MCNKKNNLKHSTIFIAEFHRIVCKHEKTTKSLIFYNFVIFSPAIVGFAAVSSARPVSCNKVKFWFYRDTFYSGVRVSYTV